MELYTLTGKTRNRRVDSVFSLIEVEYTNGTKTAFMPVQGLWKRSGYYQSDTYSDYYDTIAQAKAKSKKYAQNKIDELNVDHDNKKVIINTLNQ